MATKDEIRRVSIYINGSDADITFKQLTAGSRKLYNEFAQLTPGTEAFKQKLLELRETNKVIQDIRDDIKGVGGAFEEIKRIAEGVSIGTLVSRGIEGAIDAVKEFIAGSEEAYDEAQRTQTQLQNVIKSTGGIAGESKKKLEEYQQSLMDQTGVDDDVIAKGQEMLLTFTNIRGKIFDETTPAVIDMTAAMNGGKVSMEGIQKTALQVGKALQDPIQGATALRKVGVQLNDQQQTQIKTLVESNHLMDAQAIILKELQKEFGGTAKAIADTDIGITQKFDTDLGNLQEKIGGYIAAGKAATAEAFDPLIKALGDTRSEASRLTDEFYKQKDNVAGLEKNTAPLINRYDELKSKASLNKDEQIELNSIISSLSETIPSAVTQWDKYGKAMGINTEKARQFIQMQKEVLKVQNADAIQKVFDELVALEGRSQRIQAQLASGVTTSMTRAGSVDDLSQKTRALTDDEIRKNAAELKDIQQKIAAASLAIKGLKGENIVIPKEDKVIEPTSGKTKAQLDADAKKKQEEQQKRQAFIDSSKALAELEKEFSATQFADTLAKNEKEIQQAENKYDQLIAKEKEFLEKAKKNKYANQDEIDKRTSAVELLETQKQNQVRVLRVKQEKELTDQINEFRDKMAGRQQTELEKEVVLINAKYDQLKNDAGTNEDALAKIELDRKTELTDAKLREEKRFQDERDKINAQGIVTEAERDKVEIAQTNKKYDDQINDLKAKFSKEIQETKAFGELIAKINKNRNDDLAKVGPPKTIKDFLAQMKPGEMAASKKDIEISSAQSVANAVFDIEKNNRQRILDSQIDALEKQKDAELSAKNLTEAQKKAINDKYAKQEADLKLKAWEADKQANLEQAVINGALAVVKALPNPFAAAAAGVAALAQIAVIEAQQPPNFYADGGYSAVSNTMPSGWVKRPTLFTNSASGRPFIAGEGNKSEYIISSQQLRDPVIANFVGMMEGIRGVRQFEAGGYSSVPAAAQRAAAIVTPSTPTANERLDRIEAAIADLAALVREEAEKSIVLSLQTMDKEQQKVVDIRTRANA